MRGQGRGLLDTIGALIDGEAASFTSLTVRPIDIAALQAAIAGQPLRIANNRLKASILDAA